MNSPRHSASAMRHVRTGWLLLFAVTLMTVGLVWHGSMGQALRPESAAARWIIDRSELHEVERQAQLGDEESVDRLVHHYTLMMSLEAADGRPFDLAFGDTESERSARRWYNRGIKMGNSSYLRIMFDEYLEYAQNEQNALEKRRLASSIALKHALSRDFCDELSAIGCRDALSRANSLVELMLVM